LYWNKNKLNYPILLVIAQKVLEIPATNTSVERLFSGSGNIVANPRTRLQTSKVDQLLLIRRNLSTLREIFLSALEQSNQSNKQKISETSTTSMKKLNDSNKNINLNEDDSISLFKYNLDSSYKEDNYKENISDNEYE